MLLKRIYNHDAPQEEWGTRSAACQECHGRGKIVETNPVDHAAAIVSCQACAGSGNVVTRVPPVSGIVVLRAGSWQNFSPSFIEGGQREGWLTRDKDRLTIHCADPPVVYRIIRQPGYYCCHCDQALDDSPTGQLHVSTAHAGSISPDPNNPSGYRWDLYYRCVMETAETKSATAEQIAIMDRKERDAISERIRAKYGDSRGAAERRRAAKGVK